MSEAATFTSEGFTPFPNFYEDSKHIGEVTEWTDERIEGKMYEVAAALERNDLMARARALGERILRHLDWEMECRYPEASEGARNGISE